MKLEQLSEFLNDHEMDKLIQFNGDTVLKEAVRKVLLAGLYQNGTLKKGKPAVTLFNAALGTVSGARANKLTDAEIGADLRAHWEGLNALEGAFNDIGKILDNKTPKVPEKNPAL